MKTHAFRSAISAAADDLEDRFDDDWELTDTEALDMAASMLYLLSEEADGNVRQVLEAFAATLGAVVDFID